MTPDEQTSVPTPAPYDAARTLRVHRFGVGDPAAQADEGGLSVWKAAHTPAGPVTVHLRHEPLAARVVVRAWGAGAGWAVSRAPALTGMQDDPSAFRPEQPAWLRELALRLRGVRLARAVCAGEIHARAILEQRVEFVQAADAWRRLTTRHGDPAPGPRPLRLPLSAKQWRELPSFEARAAGVELKRHRALLVAARAAEALQAAVDDREALRARLESLHGTGPWTTALVMAWAGGDPDAVPVGDYHHAHMVARAFAGEERGTDARMLELLEPYRGHRFRVVQWLLMSGHSPPRRTHRRRLHA